MELTIHIDLYQVLNDTLLIECAQDIEVTAAEDPQIIYKYEPRHVIVNGNHFRPIIADAEPVCQIVVDGSVYNFTAEVLSQTRAACLLDTDFTGMLSTDSTHAV